MLRRFWEGWKRVGQRIGDGVARVFLSVFYFTIFLPFGLISRLFADPLHIKTHDADLWRDRTHQDFSIKDLRSQS